MGGDWPTLSLREANVTLIDCDHRTPPASETGYPYVTIPQLRGGRINLSHVRRIKREHFVEWTRKAKPSANDVILSRRCNPGETAVVPAGLEFALGQNLVLLRADGSKVYPPFLRWLVRGPEWWDQISKFLNVGAVFDSLRCSDVLNFELCIPPLPKQRAIAHIGGTLDDKIELNRRMNETLEALASAVLLNGGLGTVAFGDIAVNIRDVVDPGAIDPGTPYIALEHMPRQSITLAEWERADSATSAKTRFQAGDILFGKLRPYFHKVGVAACDGVCSTDILVIRPKSPQLHALTVAVASSSPFVAHATATSTGTKMPRASWRDLADYEFLAHDYARLTELNEFVDPLLARIGANIRESRTLAALRDALLPKLISGELRICDAEQAVELA